jgi:hypothetical protein
MMQAESTAPELCVVIFTGMPFISLNAANAAMMSPPPLDIE